MTSTLQGTFSTLHSTAPPARPLFTLLGSLFLWELLDKMILISSVEHRPYDLKRTNDEEDILYQWRLRRKLEEAQHQREFPLKNKVYSS